MVHTSAGIPFSVDFQLSVSLCSRISFTTLYWAGAALFAACARNFAAGCQATATRAMGASHRSLRNRVVFMITSSMLFRRAENSRSFSQDFCDGQATWLNLDKSESSQVHNLSSMIF